MLNLFLDVWWRLWVHRLSRNAGVTDTVLLNKFNRTAREWESTQGAQKSWLKWEIWVSVSVFEVFRGVRATCYESWLWVGLVENKNGYCGSQRCVGDIWSWLNVVFWCWKCFQWLSIFLSPLKDSRDRHIYGAYMTACFWATKNYWEMLREVETSASVSEAPIKYPTPLTGCFQPVFPRFISPSSTWQFQSRPSTISPSNAIC